MSKSWGRFGLVIFVLVLTVVLERVMRRLMDRSFETTSRHIKVDHTQYVVVKHVLSAVIYILGIGIAVAMIPALKSLAISLFAGAGVLAVVIGFASQQAFSNIVSGIFIAIFKPFRVDDRIKIGDTSGIVEDITLRHTVIRTFENKRILVPNSVINNERIENASISDPKTIRFIDFQISYESNLEKAMKIMQTEAENHPDCLDNRSFQEKRDEVPIVPVKVIGFGDSSVNLRAWVWAKDAATAWKVGCDLNKSIKLAFDKKGIEIPYPHRTIVKKK